ncbi:Probable metal transport system membrane protein CPn_0347/CP_0413/CPj0347/CpB0354 [Chlamydiales bacterium SCGC AG-110-M15]|nr:Probable metal transport system membrane protein CPn_0347/CP_0413/CPj0347/CpB0354 [Chlamydiales bacterium SCGC AG-110-M15]
MSLSAALVGVIVLLRKQSLLGESLSHAAYPGVILALLLHAILLPESGSEFCLTTFILFGAFISALLGLYSIRALEEHLNIRHDSAMCFVLAIFFGVGITMASRVQYTHTDLYTKVQSYLYGQAATMTMVHVYVYGFIAAIVILAVILLYKELQIVNFDRDFAISTGVRAKLIEAFAFFLIVLAITVGLRSVGVVLMSAMLIAPAAAARQYTNHLGMILFLAALIGLISGFFGVYSSVVLTDYFHIQYPGKYVSLPTGPMIVIVASSICFFSLLFAPERGLLLRFARRVMFRYKCLQENILKAIWKYQEKDGLNIKGINQFLNTYQTLLLFALKRLEMQGWLVKSQDGMYTLTKDGMHKAAHIVRLHRLWEVYLVNHLGFGVDRVHANAEEMEHIITPEIEARLTDLLHDPQHDPHFQPIPPKGETI